MIIVGVQNNQTSGVFETPGSIANKYDLSASRYRQIEPDGVYYEKPEVTMERLLTLERVMAEEVRELKRLLG